MTDIYMTVFAGITMLTDQKDLASMLDKPLDGITPEEAVTQLSQSYPGLFEAAVKGMNELELRRQKPSIILYLNFRVQVWAIGFDDNPSSISRAVPAGSGRRHKEDLQNSLDSSYKN